MLLNPSIWNRLVWWCCPTELVRRYESVHRYPHLSSSESAPNCDHQNHDWNNYNYDNSCNVHQNSLSTLGMLLHAPASHTLHRICSELGEVPTCMLSAYVWGTATLNCDPIFQLIEFLKFIKFIINSRLYQCYWIPLFGIGWFGDAAPPN